MSATGPEPVKIILAYDDGATTTVLRSGASSYSILDTHDFGGCDGAWAVTVTSNPPGANQPRTADTKC